MKKGTNILLLILVVALVAIPLKFVKRPAPGADGKEVEIFQGSDDQAKGLITEIVPTYKPWAHPLFEPPSGEVESGLFALQAALGAGFIGFFLGSRTARARLAGKAEREEA